MKTCKTFQQQMEKLARIAGVDLYEGSGAFVKAKVSDGIMPLSVENIGFNQIAVHHTYIQNGDVMMDPEVVFFVGYGEWVPMSFQQDGSIPVHDVAARADSQRVTHLAPGRQADIARFVNQWGRTLSMQGFFEPEKVDIVRSERSWQAIEREEAAKAA